jgi:Mn2+/Fe2+ NRAMP family transporter
MSSPAPKPSWLAAVGAAFLMATSAIGPGFLTQTTQFTKDLGANLGFAILVSILIDIGAQLNTWRVLGVSGKRGHELADAVLPGLGWLLAVVVIGGSFLFNLGNISGCAQGLEVFGLHPLVGMIVSAGITLLLFLNPKLMAGIGVFSIALGVAMILLTLYILGVTSPPYGEAAARSVWPNEVNADKTITLVGGTIGGYIMFSGAHGLLDSGVQGVSQLSRITWASVQGILITGLMRTVLFLAVLGVVVAGATFSNERPVFDAFQFAAGNVGLIVAGLVFWAAAITSVVGCSYTAVSFLPRSGGQPSRPALLLFLGLSLIVTVVLFLTRWEPKTILIGAGTVNGVLMPIVLGVVLLAAYRQSLVGEYRHPLWATILGAVAWVASVYLAFETVRKSLFAS